MKAQTHTEAEYECKHCGETTDELAAGECDVSTTGFHAWNHTNPENTAGTDATVGKDGEADGEEETDGWKTMSSEECKRQAGLKQVDGVVWGQTDDNPTDGYWNPGGSECPACGDSTNQEVVARPAQNTDVEMSLPDRVVECGACGVEWEE